VNVAPIQPWEHPPALYTVIGFPRPVSALLETEGLGGVRYARFERGVLFIETVTEWEELTRIGFRVQADTRAIPATTLDPHVTVGGRFFDVLTGRYDIEPLEGGAVRLVLTSRHRVSTMFNVYAGAWADLVMRSIQQTILGIIRARCEAGARSAGFPGG